MLRGTLLGPMLVYGAAQSSTAPMQSLTSPRGHSKSSKCNTHTYFNILQSLALHVRFIVAKKPVKGTLASCTRAMS